MHFTVFGHSAGDLVLAYLPAIGVTFYVVLDHLWEHLWNSKLNGAKEKWAKRATVIAVIIAAFLSGSVQLSKSEDDSEATDDMRKQLNIANSNTSSMRKD